MKKERETANKYRQQALEGDLMAMNNMGVCYAQGIGVVEDHVMAFQWYMKAAELGDIYACYNVAECYYQGDGVEQDFERALHWYLIAAEKGDVQSQVNAANAFYLGQGTKEDHVKAHQWWLKAAQGGTSSEPQPKDLSMPNNGAGTMGTVYINNNVVKQMKTDLRLIQEQQPLVHNITNYVAMNFVANSLLAIGASPIMARAEEEVEEISSKSNALALNLGVPESTTAHSMILAGEAAMKKRIPIVFDVVGVGATRFRMDIASQIILRCHPTVIKGNASEIQALYSHQIGMQGVDSHQETYEVEKQAKKLAQQLSCIIVVTGAIDFITDGERMAYVHEGHSMMSKVTAMGCTATGIVGAFLAVNSDPLEASFHAMKAMGIAGERAASQSRGNGSMMINFLDELCNLVADD